MIINDIPVVWNYFATASYGWVRILPTL